MTIYGSAITGEYIAVNKSRDVADGTAFTIYSAQDRPLATINLDVKDIEALGRELLVEAAVAGMAEQPKQPELSRELQEGDYVRVRADKSDDDIAYGQIGRIVQFDEDDDNLPYRVEFWPGATTDGSARGAWSWMSLADVEYVDPDGVIGTPAVRGSYKIPQDQPAHDHTLQVGDRVNHPQYGTGKIIEVDEAVINGTNNDDMPYRVEYDQGAAWWSGSDEVERI